MARFYARSHWQETIKGSHRAENLVPVLGTTYTRPADRLQTQLCRGPGVKLVDCGNGNLPGRSIVTINAEITCNYHLDHCYRHKDPGRQTRCDRRGWRLVVADVMIVRYKIRATFLTPPAL